MSYRLIGVFAGFLAIVIGYFLDRRYRKEEVGITIGYVIKIGGAVVIILSLAFEKLW